MNLVFIPGWSFSKTIWQRQEEYFSGLGFKVSLWDLDELDKLFTQVKLTDMVFVAWSLGWYRLLYLLKEDIGQPRAIVGVSGALKFRPSLMRLMLNDFNKDSAFFLARFDSWLFSAQERALPDFLALKNFISANRIVDAAYLCEGLSFLKTADISDCALSAKCQFLLLSGREDLVCPVDDVLGLKKYFPEAEFSIFENTGHMPFLTHEADFNRVLLNYLKKLNSNVG